MKSFRRITIAVLALAAIIVPIRMALAYTIDGTVSAQFQCNDRRTVGINTSANLPVNFTPNIAFSNGSGADQGNVLYQGSLSLSSGTFSFDLNGTLADSYGSTVSLVRVKAIAFQNNSASNNMTVGDAASDAFNTLLNSTGTITMPPGAWFMFATPDATGWAVTASTADLIKIAGTGTDSFTIIVLGSST